MRAGPPSDGGSAQDAVRVALRKRYPDLWRDGFPRIAPRSVSASEIELEALPAENALGKSARRLLLIQPWAAVGGADKFNLDFVAQLRSRSWETTIVTTLDGDHSWLPHYTRLTPDVFALSHLVRPEDYPRFLRYIIRSRQPDAVVISHSQFAYEALAYLRWVAGETPIVDYCHIADERWLDGGYPRMSVDRREFLDLHMASSKALRDWMVVRGCDPERVDVCYTNIDPRDAAERPSRAELSLPEGVPIIVYPARMERAEAAARVRRDDAGAPAAGTRVPRARSRHGAAAAPAARVRSPKRVSRRTFASSGCSRTRESRSSSPPPTASLSPRRRRGSRWRSTRRSRPESPSSARTSAASASSSRRSAGSSSGAPTRPPRSGATPTRSASCSTIPTRRRAMGEAGRARIREHFTLDGMGELMEELLARAAELAASDPRPVPSANDARSAALDGVRLVNEARAAAHSQWGVLLSQL